LGQGHDLVNRLDDGAVQILVGFRRGPVQDLHGVGAARHLHHGRVVKMAGEARHIDGGGGDDDFQIRAPGQQLLDVTQQEVDVEAALVGLVDDQGVVAGQVPVVLDLREQYAVGHQL